MSRTRALCATAALLAAAGCGPSPATPGTPGASTAPGTAASATPGGSASAAPAAPANAAVTVTGWTELTGAGAVSQFGGSGPFAVDETGAIWMVAGNAELYKAAAGETKFTVQPGATAAAIVRNTAGDIYVGTVPTGLSRRARGASAWTPVGEGVPAAVLTTDGAGNVFAASGITQGAGGHKLHKLAAGSEAWVPVPVGKAITLPNFRVPTVDPAGNVYHVDSDGKLFKSAPGGEPAEVAQGGFTATYTDKAGAVYAVQARAGVVVKAAPGGGAWTPMPGEGGKAYVAVGARIVEDAAGNLFTHDGTGIQKLAAGGTTWSPLPAKPTGASGELKELVIDGDNRLYVGYSSGQVLRSNP